ncbi:hypothetical protein HD806DRAFT_537415 [Xylariaceae sp. AK1471]|nr:hypothetical protein HD806DRAFT_537415 [Xylariaceae sp. AK1471]
MLSTRSGMTPSMAAQRSNKRRRLSSDIDIEHSPAKRPSLESQLDMSPHKEVPKNATRADIDSVPSNIPDTKEESDIKRKPGIKEEPGTKAEPNIKEESDDELVDPYHNLPNDANFTTANPHADRLVPRRIGDFPGVCRRRRLIDDLFDRVRKEDPEKFEQYRIRLQPVRRPVSTYQAQARAQGQRATGYVTNGTNMMETTPGSEARIPCTKDHFTGATRPRRMIDDVFDKTKEENPAKFAEYVQRRKRARRQMRNNAII